MQQVAVLDRSEVRRQGGLLKRDAGFETSRDAFFPIYALIPDL